MTSFGRIRFMNFKIAISTLSSFRLKKPLTRSTVSIGKSSYVLNTSIRGLGSPSETSWKIESITSGGN